MTKPQEPKRFNIVATVEETFNVRSTKFNSHITFANVSADGEYMLAEEALAYAEAVRQEALEEAAIAVENHDKTGRDWVKDSLWDRITKEMAAQIRNLKPEGK